MCYSFYGFLFSGSVLEVPFLLRDLKPEINLPLPRMSYKKERLLQTATNAEN